MTTCPECGASFDEIPLEQCETHRKHLAAEPELTDDELEAHLEDLVAEITQEQS